MAEYIGSRISLISKRDIRYVGTLHEISSENSTVALEQVVSFGTEDRNTNPSEFVPPADNVYEYIVFRGSDVKDLRIEKEPEKKPIQQPQVPDDPAILGNSRPVAPNSTPNAAPGQPQEQFSQQSGQFNQHHDHQGPPPRFPQQPQFPFNYPPNQRFGPQGNYGFSPYGHPGMHHGPPPPGWYPPPTHGYPPGPQNHHYPGPNMAPGPPGIRPPSKSLTPAEVTASQGPVQQPSGSEKPTATVKLPSSSATPAPPSNIQNGPPPPTESKPDVATALAPPAPSAVTTAESTTSKPTVAAPKSGRIMPAIPIMNSAQKSKAPINGTLPLKQENEIAKQKGSATGSKSYEDANRDARAAVAAAMAKLPPAQAPPKKQGNGEASAVDNLTAKVNEMRTDENMRAAKHASGGSAPGARGGRGGTYRGGRPRTESQTKKIEVPKTDYDFASANAKFNKDELAKEAQAASSPAAGTPTEGVNGESTEASDDTARVTIPIAAGYNKSNSFFDNISSESKDREDPVAGKRLGGREFRSEEHKKNFETFGQGSVDGARRGGFRGRGRGRGFRGGRGRGGPRGRGNVAAAEG